MNVSSHLLNQPKTIDTLETIVQENERYYSYSKYLQQTFGEKTYKVVVASGLTCPTRDGALSKGGCAFCDVRGSGSFFGKQGRGSQVKEQIQNRIPSIQKRFGAKKFLVYFQSYTNTYSDVHYLRQIYTEALAEPQVSGLCIGTRPDCLPDSVIELLEELAQKTYVSLELGIQSFEDSTLEWLTRGHNGQCSLDILEKLKIKAPHVHLCVHFIFGSPTDSLNMAKNTALTLNQFNVKGAKLHQLMVLEHTELGRRWKQNPFHTLSIEEYTDQVIEFLEHLSPSIYLERLCATASHAEECLAPEWSRNRWEPHNQMRDFLNSKNCIQGAKLL